MRELVWGKLQLDNSRTSRTACCSVVDAAEGDRGGGNRSRSASAPAASANAPAPEAVPPAVQLQSSVEEQARRIFRQLDLDGNGFLTFEELKQVRGSR